MSNKPPSLQRDLGQVIFRKRQELSDCVLGLVLQKHLRSHTNLPERRGTRAMNQIVFQALLQEGARIKNHTVCRTRASQEGSP